MPKTAACLACGTFERTPVLTLEERWRIESCPACGMHTLDPSPDEVVLDEFESGSGYDGAFSLEQDMLEISKKTLVRLGKFAPGRRILDVGSGPGFLLKAAHASGWQAVALDPSSFAVAQARKFGFEAHEGLLEDVNLPAESFDAIALLQVIEHVSDPRPLLAACRRLLRPGGAIAVATPNPASLLARTKREAFNYWIPPVHCVWYTPRALTMVLRRAGFRVAEKATWSARSERLHDGVDALRHTRIGKHLPARTHRFAGDLLAKTSDRLGRGSIVEQVGIKEGR